MGCTSGKIDSESQKYQHMLEKLLQSFQSLEQYIQNQRSTVYTYLAQNGDVVVHLENQKERNSLINICQDINNFRKYKKINKYKYELAIPKFFKQIKFCMYKLQVVLEMYNEFTDKLELAKLSNDGQKFSKKNEMMIATVSKQVTMISSYLQMNKDLIDEDNKQTMCQLSNDLKNPINNNQITSASDIDFEDIKVK